MTIVAADQLRGKTVDITLRDADENPIVVVAADVLRAMITRRTELGGTAELPTGHKLLVRSDDGGTLNGSTFTKDTPAVNTHRLRLDAQDLDFEHGTYTLVIDFFDNADAAEWKTVDRQVFILGETAL